VFEKVYREYMRQHVEEAPHLDSLKKQSKQLNSTLKITQVMQFKVLAEYMFLNSFVTGEKWDIRVI